MKKFLGKVFAVFTAAMLALSLFACGNDDTPAKTVNVYMPDGAPAVALASFMDSGYADTEFTVVAASTIAQRVSTGAADLAIVPINAAASLYNGGKDIVMLTVNTHGNLFIVGSGENITLGDLVGKRLGVIGQGNVPDQVLRMLLGKAGIEYAVSDAAVPGKVAVRYADDGGTLLPLLGKGDVDYAFLAEPAATNAVNKFQKSVVADVQQLWSEQFDFAYPQACLVVQRSFLENNTAYVEKFIKDLAETDGWAAENPDKALEAIKAHVEDGTQSSLTALNATIVTHCNIATKTAAEMRDACDKYLTLLTTLEAGNGTTVLAKIPDSKFYYKAV